MLVGIAAACGSPDEETTAGTGSSSSSSGGAGGTGGAGGFEPVTCAATPMDHAADCPEPCPIAADVEVRCDDDEFAAPGIRVAPAPEGTWLVTSSGADRMLFDVTAAGAIRDEALPASLIRQPVGAALGPAGELHLMADSTVGYGADYPGGLLHLARAGDAWQESLVFDTAKYIPPIDIDAGSDGVVHLWFTSDAPSQQTHAVPDGAGGWTLEPAPSPAGSDWPRFTIGDDGRIVALGFAEALPGNWQLRTLIDGQERALGAMFFDNFPLHYVVTHAASPTLPLPGGPAFAAAIQHRDGLSVAWPTAASYDEVAIPESGLPVPVCEGYYDNGCPGPCHETAVGVEESALGIARTTDGRIWLTYVVTHYDIQIHYEQRNDPELGPYCAAVFDQDDTSAVLHLVEVPTSGAPPAPALAVPMRPPALADLFISWHDFPRAVDVRAFGSALAIGVRTSSSTPDRAAVRVLRIETGPMP